jgi:hypothetical protein
MEASKYLICDIVDQVATAVVIFEAGNITKLDDIMREAIRLSFLNLIAETYPSAKITSITIVDGKIQTAFEVVGIQEHFVCCIQCLNLNSNVHVQSGFVSNSDFQARIESKESEFVSFLTTVNPAWKVCLLIIVRL